MHSPVCLSGHPTLVSTTHHPSGRPSQHPQCYSHARPASPAEELKAPATSVFSSRVSTSPIRSITATSICFIPARAHILPRAPGSPINRHVATSMRNSILLPFGYPAAAVRWPLETWHPPPSRDVEGPRPRPNPGFSESRGSLTSPPFPQKHI